MTPLEKFIEDSQRICDAATPFPWLAFPNKHGQADDHYGDWSVDTLADVSNDPRRTEHDDNTVIADDFRTKEDAAFAAHARTALPAALQHLRELMQRNLSLTDDRKLLSRRMDGLMVERDALSKTVDAANISNSLLSRRVAELEGRDLERKIAANQMLND